MKANELTSELPTLFYEHTWLMLSLGVLLILLLFLALFFRKTNSNPHFQSNTTSHALAHISMPIWERDASLTIVYHNPACEPLLKKHKGENELFPGGKLLAEKARDAKAPFSEKLHTAIAGNRHFYEITETPTDTGTVGFALDITELEYKENELKQHRSVQSDLIENTSSAIAIYGLDKKLKFFNNAFANLWKLEERWLESKPTYGDVLEKLREKRKLPEQANFPAFKKENVGFFTNLLEKHEDFYYLPDERVLRVIIIPHEEGGLLFSYEDMSDQLALERSYNTLLSVKKSTIDHLSEGVAVFGENGRLQLCNPAYADLWQLDPGTLEAEPHISEILEETKFLYDYEDNWEAYKDNIVTKTVDRTPSESWLIRQDDSVLHWMCVPLPDGATLMTYTDVTDSYRVEQSLRAEKEALEEADRIKSSFLSNISYQLRSPLTSIRGFSEILLQQYFGKMNEKQEEYVKGIFDSSLRLTSLINNILDAASINAGYMTLEISDFDVCEVLSSATHMVEESIQQFKPDLKVNCAPDVGRMTGDRERIKQVVSNLLSNAIRFSKPGGKVTLSANLEGSDVLVIMVEDQGTGIPLEEQPYVFDKFYKIHSDDYSGTGLGLTIAKSFVELHGGTIELYSDEENGTKIICKLLRRNPELLKSHKRANAA